MDSFSHFNPIIQIKKKCLRIFAGIFNPPFLSEKRISSSVHSPFLLTRVEFFWSTLTTKHDASILSPSCSHSPQPHVEAGTISISTSFQVFRLGPTDPSLSLVMTRLLRITRFLDVASATLKLSWIKISICMSFPPVLLAALSGTCACQRIGKEALHSFSPIQNSYFSLPPRFGDVPFCSEECRNTAFQTVQNRQVQFRTN